MPEGKAVSLTRSKAVRNLRVGLPVMLLCMLLTTAGAYFALRLLYLEDQLDRRGIEVQATLLKKFEVPDWDRPRYHFRYSFQVDSRVITNESRVDEETYRSANEGDHLPVRYLADDPERNLLLKRYKSSFLKICGILNAVLAVSFLGACLGMIVTRLKGGAGGSDTQDSAARKKSELAKLKKRLRDKNRSESRKRQTSGSKKKSPADSGEA